MKEHGSTVATSPDGHKVVIMQFDHKGAHRYAAYLGSTKLLTGTYRKVNRLPLKHVLMRVDHYLQYHDDIVLRERV